jgi:uncharacterized protein (DUF486 family)
MRTIILLTISNVFMTFAWYGHLKYRTSALWKVILVSWGIAFFEYCFQVPANRIGSYEFSTAQLKTIQEVITLSVFSVFSILYLGEKLRWNYLAGFGCISLGSFLSSTSGKHLRGSSESQSPRLPYDYVLSLRKMKQRLRRR